MVDTDKWIEILATLRSNTLRTALTALGVIWGIMMLLIMLAAGNGLSNGVSQRMRGAATNAVYVWGQRTTVPHAGLQPGREVQFDTGDVLAIASGVDGLEHLAPRNQLRGRGGTNTVRRGAEVGAFTVMGDYPQVRAIQPMNIVSGRFLNPLDIADARKVAVIGTRVQETLFQPGEAPMGQWIAIGGVYFQVVGVVASLATGDRGERQAQTIHVPFTTFQQAFNYGDRVGWFMITAQPDRDAAVVEGDVRAVLAARHAVAPADEQAIGSFNARKEFGKMQNLFTGIRLFIWIVGAITLLAGVIGVSNIMLISIKERTKEIGVRKALGATPLSVVITIIQESVLITSIAGYVGVILAVGIIELMGNLEADAFANPSVDFATTLIATAILIVSGAIAGVIPAWHAASVDPVEALRAE